MKNGRYYKSIKRIFKDANYSEYLAVKETGGKIEFGDLNGDWGVVYSDIDTLCEAIEDFASIDRWSLSFDVHDKEELVGFFLYHHCHLTKEEYLKKVEREPQLTNEEILKMIEESFNAN